MLKTWRPPSRSGNCYRCQCVDEDQSEDVKKDELFDEIKESKRQRGWQALVEACHSSLFLRKVLVVATFHFNLQTL
jgi:hypothetical protein